MAMRSLASFYNHWLRDAPVPGRTLESAKRFAKVNRDAGIEVDEFFDYRLWRPRLSENDMLAFSGWRRHVYGLTLLNPLPYRACTEDKVLFAKLCLGNELPHPEILGVVDCEEDSNLGAYESLSTLEGMQSLLRREHVERFVTKPVHGTRGQNISVWETVNGEICRHDGMVLSPENFDKMFSYGYRGQDASQFLLQRRIEPSLIAADYPTRCPLSFRVITLIDNDDQIQILYCYLKIPAPNEVVDNVSQGGYVAPLDAAARIMGFYHQGDTDDLSDTHPSGLAMNSRPPQVDEVIALARKAAGVFSHSRCVAWDIACDEQGAALIEANNPFSMNVQRIFDRGIWRTEFQAAVEKVAVDGACPPPWWPEVSTSGSFNEKVA